MNHIDEEILAHFAEDERHQLAHEDEMRNISSEMARMHEKLDTLIKRSNPALEFFEGMTWTKKFVLGLLGTFAAVGSAYLLYKEIVKRISE